MLVVFIVCASFIARDYSIVARVIADESQSSYFCGTYSTNSPLGASGSSIASDPDNLFDVTSAIDSDSNTYWKSSNSYPQWIAFSLGELKCVNALELSIDSSALPVQADIQISDDGDNWQTVAANAVINQNTVVISFEEQLAGYVRVYETSGGVSQAVLSEIRVSSAPVELSDAEVLFCGDSDGGKNYAVNGTVNSSGSSLLFADTCLNETVLQEQYCNEVDAAVERHTCMSGEVCSKGACIAVTPAHNETNSSVVQQTEQPQTTKVTGSLVPITQPLGVHLQPNEQTSIIIGGSSYTLRVTSLSSTLADIELLPSHTTAQLQLETPQTLDLNNDGAQDISIRVTSLDSREVSMSITLLTEAYLFVHTQCFLYPPSCPVTGNQLRICVDVNNPALGATKEQLSCSPGGCGGCMKEGICLSYGTRLRDYASGGGDKYCGSDGTLHDQQDALFLSPSGESVKSTCSYDYECTTNRCVEGACVGVAEVITSAPERQSKSVHVLCKLANALDEKEYESCLLQFLGS